MAFGRTGMRHVEDGDSQLDAETKRLSRRDSRVVNVERSGRTQGKRDKDVREAVCRLKGREWSGML